MQLSCIIQKTVVPILTTMGYYKSYLSSSAMIHEPCGKGVWYIDAKLSTDTYSHVYFQTTCLQVHRVFHLFNFVSCAFYYSFYFVQCVFQCKDLFDYKITSFSLIKCIFKVFIESPESRQF